MKQLFKNNILHAKTEAVINPVNTQGVMGAGLAKTFRDSYPEMFEEYRKVCKEGGLSVGSIHTYQESKHLIVNLPTKDDWRDSSRIEYVEDGLDAVIEYVKENPIKSIAIPPLGTGLGELNHSMVYPVMDEKMKKLAKLGVDVHYYNKDNEIEVYRNDGDHGVLVGKPEPNKRQDNFKTRRIVAVGHRPNKLVGGWDNYLDTEEAKQLYEDYQMFIEERINEYGHVTAYSGMSQGTDIIFAQAALNTRDRYPDQVRFISHIPFAGQEDTWPEKARETYRDILELSDTTTKDTTNYTYRNKKLVELGDEFLVTYDGFDTEGAASRMVDSIRQSEKKLTNIGGYMMDSNHVSEEVIHNMYAPTRGSIKMLAKLEVSTIINDNENKDVKDIFKNSMRRNKEYIRQSLRDGTPNRINEIDV